MVQFCREALVKSYTLLGLGCAETWVTSCSLPAQLLGWMEV